MTPAPATSPFLPSFAPSSGDTGSRVDAAMMSDAMASDSTSGTLSQTDSMKRATPSSANVSGAGWRLFLPESWDDASAADVETASEIRRRRTRAKIPDEVRHREKWRLALDMLDEITGDQAGGAWG